MTGGAQDLGPDAVVPAVEESRAAGPATVDHSASSWWQRYCDALKVRLSPQALAVLEADARHIVEKAFPQAEGQLDTDLWPSSGVRTGMVVGSVQSGKTASMLGVAALALGVAPAKPDTQRLQTSG